MKQLFTYLILVITLCTSCNRVNAQSLKVIYNERVNIKSALQQIDDPQLAALVEKKLNSEQKSSQLIYNSGVSVYKPDQTTRGADRSVVYKNFKENKRVVQETILDRNFLIKDALTKIDWSLENESEQFLGYTCKKAVNKDGVTAWYCPDLPISDGPASYFGLPGIIVRLESNTKVYTATEITAQGIDTTEIQQPTQGKSVTREEFNKIKAEKLKSMGISEGTKGIKVIRM